MNFESLENWKEKSNDVVVLYPGSFKPIHSGHLFLIKKYTSLPEVKEVKVFIGPGIRNNINQSISITIAKLFLKNNPKVSVEASKYPSPVLTAYKFVETAPPGNYTLASSSKEKENLERIQKFIEQHQPGGKYYDKLGIGVNIIPLSVDISPKIYEGRKDEHDGKPISASILRKDIMNDDEENFITNYPNEDPNIVWDVWNMLHGNLTE